jgi:glucose-6-phosphate 1-dehydrogenase
MVDSRKTISLPGLEDGRKADEPCTIVIFGASGDLTARKLIPALYHLHLEGQMPESCRVIGFARREKTDASWRDEMRAGVETYSRTQQVDDARWDAFAANLSYHRGDLTDAGAYTGLAKRLADFGEPRLVNNLVFYLAISPSLFGELVDQLHAA